MGIARTVRVLLAALALTAAGAVAASSASAAPSGGTVTPDSRSWG
jgi:ABC-type proline/glycine betaine transport system substrate-binding protein